MSGNLELKDGHTATKDVSGGPEMLLNRPIPLKAYIDAIRRIKVNVMNVYNSL